MGLAPLAHTLDVMRIPEVVATEGRAKPSALAGQFPGVSAGGLAAVMLAVVVAVIGEEEIVATAALTSNGPQTHREPRATRSGRKLKQNKPEGRRPKTKKEEVFLREVPEENSGKKKEFQTGGFRVISFRR